LNVGATVWSSVAAVCCFADIKATKKSSLAYLYIVEDTTLNSRVWK